MPRIRIFDKFGDHCVNGTTAKEFADSEIAPILKSGERVIIDFTGVEMASSSFINSIIFNTYGYNIVDNQVSFESDDELIESMINHSIDKLETSLE